MGSRKRRKSVKKRIPLPLKPPMVEPNPKAYKRHEKHHKAWQQEEHRDFDQASEHDRK